MAFAIEKGTPIPKLGELQRLYPFGQLEVGECLLIPVSTGAQVRSIRCAANIFARKNPGYRFTVRKMNDGVRVWRIAIYGQS